MSSHEVRMTRAERRLGRFELMSWINSFLRTEYTKVEEFSDGIAYCQVLDAMIPDSVPLHALDYNPTDVPARVKNLKVFDRALRKCAIHKPLNIPSLAKGSFQENHDLLGWCFAMVQQNCPHVVTSYRAFERRIQAMRRQKHASSTAALKPLTNRLIPSDIGMSLFLGGRADNGDGDGPESATPSPTISDIDAEIEREYRRISPGPALLRPRDGGGADEAEVATMEDVLLEIEENLVLRLKTFDKLREKVRVEKARRDFFRAKLERLDDLCELMPDSKLSAQCRDILRA